MIEYIYIVKCPGCEDEMFNFFTDARMQCDLLMSKKPSITQVEVERNDFGECTDHHDLGTVWSWEEAMKDTKDGYTETEPATSIFTKDDFAAFEGDYNPENDPEFYEMDNSIDCEPETPEVSSVERKPIPDGMTIEQLVEEMEENEDTVECTWCEELFDKSECRKEVDLGWLCSRCEMAIKSRGEALTFREGSYWDFLDEDITAERSIEELVRDSINHLVNDIGKDSNAEDFVDDVILDIERNYDNFVPERPENHRKWASAIACEVSRQLNNLLTEASLSDIAAAANSEFGTFWDDDYLLDTAGVDDDFRSIGSFGDSLPKKTRELSPEEIAEREAKAAEHERQKNMRFAQRYVAKYGAERYNTQYPVRRQNWRQEWPYYDEATGEFVEGERRDELVKKFEDEQHAKRMAEYEERQNQPRWYIQTRYNGKWHNLMNTTATTKEDAESWALDYMKNLEAKRRAAGSRFDWKETDIRVIAGKGPGPGALQRFEEDLEPEAVHDLGNEYDGGYPAETLEVSDSHLRLCPECGKETFDIETGICVDCGFN